jgi:phosphoglycolate phosphatase
MLMQVKTNQIRAVVFDLDGTLVDTLPDLTSAVNATLTALGARNLTQARVKVLVGDGADKLVARAVAEATTGEPELTDADEQARAMQLFFRYYAEHLYVQSRVYPDAARVLRILREQGFRVGCVTNKSSRFAIPVLELAGLSGFLDLTLCADRNEDRKPSPALLLKACSRLQLSPEEMLYVGDSHTDVIAAHAAGCGAVAVTFGYHREGSLERVNPEATVASLTDIVTDVLPLFSGSAGSSARIQEVPT